MTPEQFTYWLQGKLEGRKIQDLGHDELKSIQDHLNTVFHKVTPTYPPTSPYIPPHNVPPNPNVPHWPPGQVIC